MKDLIPNFINHSFLEASAGTGSFITSLVNNGVDVNNILSFDINPKHPLVEKDNYLTKHIDYSDNRIIIGNPPFGYKGSLACDFINKGLDEAPIVIMILPNIFNRYSVQSKIKPGAKLLFSKPVDNNSFLLDNKVYDVKCVYQIWVNESYNVLNLDDIRIKVKPNNTHVDFKTWIHNNTATTLKYFDKSIYGWDIALHRQGYYDYSKIITNLKDLVKNRQYLFIKFINPISKDIIYNMDISKLALSSTQVLGYSNSDFVREYEIIKSLYENGEI